MQVLELELLQILQMQEPELESNETKKLDS
jgi:hypothetical protein